MPIHSIDDLDGFWVDVELDRTLHIGWEDEETLYFDLFDCATAATSEEGECLSSVLLDLRSGRFKLVH